MESELLRKAIKERGMKITFLADKMGISRQSLHAKINGDRLFDQGELLSLKTCLSMSDREFMSIFFEDRVDKLSAKVEK